MFYNKSLNYSLFLIIAKGFLSFILLKRNYYIAGS